MTDHKILLARDISARSESMQAHLIAIRRDIHAHPELGFDTVRTAAIVEQELLRLGLTPQTGVGRTGVMVDITGAQPGKTVLLRADMDALPIHEQTGLPFSSIWPGKMHACGHDIHTATLLGVAAILADLRSQLQGTVRLIFQPAEETPESGAQAMIAAGAADGIDVAITLHNKPELAAGEIALTRGASTASSDEFDVVIHGKSTHAARPHMGTDPIIAAASLVTQLQTIVSRELDPANSAVLTIGHIHGGTTHNIISDSCLIQGTIRAKSPQARAHMEDAFRRICAGVALSLNTRIEVNYQRGVPPLMNDDALIDALEPILSHQFGKPVVAKPSSSFGAEDFSLFTERVPGCQIHIGSGAPGRDDHLHNSDYQPDERSIHAGTQALARIAIDLLS
ncbi:M20 family metallopeptidase [Pantoea dispersa]|uniref:M20 metallopeptidase family protein n=1 Tax=Pantoea TaxID=53335 RepID=UPI000736C969|nr:amidohydrolase [Pantoea sp. B_9]KAA6117213.1 amidohydrolase [Pantoea sp. B_10]KTS34383.1 N-acyl-L-amino acid amidohydrolase [Pantoea dispersa]KTS58536.1 N-acyl-L-amino acid amidohydrolase [Pantoea dispersa]